MNSRTLIDIFTTHKVAANLAMVMMVLSGLWAVSRVNTQLDPTMQFPRVNIGISWRGASAEDVEQLIVVPIEQHLRTLNELQDLYSTSYNGGASIGVNFGFDTDMTLALDRVKERLGQIRNLPVEMEPPRISRPIDMENIAVVLVKGEGGLSELIPLVRDMEKALLARGIDEVWFDGLPAEELAIQVSSATLQELGTNLDTLAREISSRSSNTPAGTIGRGHGSRQLRSLDQKRDASGFEQLQVAVSQDGRLIKLSEIADIERRPKDGQPRLTRDGAAAIEMHLNRNTDSDAIVAAETLHEWLDEVRPTLPPGVEIHVYQEVWVLLKKQLELIFENGLTGLVLVIFTLFLFLNGRVGFWVMVGIPVSFLFATLLYYGFFEGSINILALITFVMALGIVVDDAIVVGEDAVTHFENGLGPNEAAAAGAKRMLVPVMTSSLTTMAAFVPLLIVGGEMGEVIVTLPTVLLCVIVASLIECFLVLPGHLRHSFENTSRAVRSEFRRAFDSRFFGLRDRHYRPLLERAIAYPGATVCIALGCVIISFSLVASQRVGLNLVTGLSLEMLEANIEFTADATEADKVRYLSHLEETLGQVTEQYGAENVSGFVTKYNRAQLNEERKFGTQYGSLLVEYAFEEDRSVGPQEFLDTWRSLVKRAPFIEQLQLQLSGGANNGQPDISLIIRGDDIPTLKQAAEELTEALLGYDGVANVVDDLPYGRDQLVFSLTPAGAALGLTTESLGGQLRSAYNGRRVQIFNSNESELEVMVMLPDDERDNIASLKQFPVRTPSGQMVPLDTIAELHNRRGIDVINHNNGEMAVRVSAMVDTDVANADQVVGHLRQHALQDILDRYGLTFGLSGVSKRNVEILETLQTGAILTLIFIYLILAWSFASYAWPVAVMSAIPLGMTGAITGHYLMGMDIGAMSFLAFFSLTGIVVNDSIVLITFFREGLREGKSVRTAITDAAVSRFRAVLLTSLTTIAGLAPMMFETFTLALYMVPIAVTLCFGLAFSTFLVLLVVPALIILIEDGKAGIAASYGPLFGRREDAQDDALQGDPTL